ncbi:MAG: chorismate mutase [Streptococcaceae bacterium]|jgi:chorismate mutase|nr:chorismate mutase [Streptococcaceae bacterium]
MNLNTIRESIDQVDSELTGLLEKRLELVCQVIEIKKAQNLSVLDEKREHDLLKKIAAQVENPEFTDCIVNTYKDIMKNSRAFQTETLK